VPACGSKGLDQALGCVQVDPAELDERGAARHVDAGGRQDHAEGICGLAKFAKEAVRAGQLIGW
jgi:hypothetical protein